MPPKIRIVTAPVAPKPKFECYACKCQTEEPCHYEDDLQTHWCSECFVTEEMMEACKKNMPIWQSLQKPKLKIKVLDKLPTVAPKPATSEKPKPKIKIVKKLPTA